MVMLPDCNRIWALARRHLARNLAQAIVCFVKSAGAGGCAAKGKSKMRILIALLLAVFMAQGTAHAAKPVASQEDVLILKKKKIAEAEKARKLKAAEAAKKLKAAEAAKKQKAAEAVKKLKAKKLAYDEARKARLAKEKVKATVRVTQRACGTAFQCFFGGRRAASSSVGLFSGVSKAKSRRIVDWTETKYTPGSIIVRTPERALYLVLGDGEAMRYSIGVGREGFQWSGNSRIVDKQEWPDWRPPAEMIRRELEEKGRVIPEFVKGGPGNPLGARALYIGGTIYRIHGTNNEASIGGAVSSGCLRMLNADVIDIYERVKVGAKVYVYQ